MKPLFILGAAVVGGILLLFAEEGAPSKGEPFKEKDDKSDGKAKLPAEEDSDSKVRRLRRELRHAERERKIHRSTQPPSAS